MTSSVTTTTASSHNHHGSSNATSMPLSTKSTLGSLASRLSTIGSITAHACTTVIHAPPQVVWETIADLEGTPAWNTMVASVERIPARSKAPKDEDDNSVVDVTKEHTLTQKSAEKTWQVGTEWYEVRMYKGDAIRQHKTITSMQHPDCSNQMTLSDRNASILTVAIHVHYPDSEFASAVNTSTLSIYPVRDMATNDIVLDQCTLIGTCAVLPPTGNNSSLPVSLLTAFRFGCTKCCFQKLAQTMFQNEMDETAAEAERRYQAMKH